MDFVKELNLKFSNVESVMKELKKRNYEFQDHEEFWNRHLKQVFEWISIQYERTQYINELIQLFLELFQVQEK